MLAHIITHNIRKFTPVFNSIHHHCHLSFFCFCHLSFHNKECPLWLRILPLNCSSFSSGDLLPPSLFPDLTSHGLLQEASFFRLSIHCYSFITQYTPTMCQALCGALWLVQGSPRERALQIVLTKVIIIIAIIIIV